MPSGSFYQVHVGCPFYKWDNGRCKITCEGVVDGSTLTTNFPNKREFRTQMDTFCCSRYICCEIYRMLMDNKYDE